MFDFAMYAGLGIVFGALTGLLPGVGISVILLTAWPFLIQTDLIFLFVFYISLITTSQYFGSVSAIMYGVMGETTSAPAVKYGNPMFKKGLGIYCLKYTAYSSLIAAVIAIGLSSAVVLHYDFFQTMLTGVFRITVITMLFVTLIVMNPQPWLAIFLLLVGLTAATVGFNDILQQHLIVSTYSVLDGGIPFVPVMVGFLVIPVLLQEIQKNHFYGNIHVAQKYRPIGLLPNWSIVRGTIVGFFCGLIPGVSYTISSNFAAALEQKISRNKIRPLIAAEAANNSAAISAVLPLLIFAIPVVPSEVILLAMAEMSGYTSQMAMTVINESWHWVVAAILAINFVAFLVANASYTIFLKVFDYTRVYVFYVALFGITAIAILVGAQYNDTVLAITTFLISLSLGMYFKNFDAKVLGVIGFLLSDQYLSDIYRQLLIQGVF